MRKEKKGNSKTKGRSGWMESENRPGEKRAKRERANPSSKATDWRESKLK